MAAGTVLECTTQRRFALTWEFGGSTSDVVVEVEAHDERTDVRLVHVADIPGETWIEYGADAGGVGWDLALLGLQRHLEEGTTEPIESTEWIDSEEARSFLADSARLLPGGDRGLSPHRPRNSFQPGSSRWACR